MGVWLQMANIASPPPFSRFEFLIRYLYCISQPDTWWMDDREGSSVLRWAFICLHRSFSVRTSFTEAGLCCCGESFWKSHRLWAELSAGWTWRRSSLGRWPRSIHCAAKPVGHIFWVVGAGAVAGSGPPRCWGVDKQSLRLGPPGCNSAAAMEACGRAHSLRPLTWIVCVNQS